MDELQVRFQDYSSRSEKTKIVPTDYSLSDALEAARLILGAPNASYQLGLERTREILNPYATFKSAGIQPNDKLVLVTIEKLEEWRSSLSTQPVSPVPKHPVAVSQDGKLYTLSLDISGSQTQNWTYSVSLTRFYEDRPWQFFIDSSNREREKFEDSLYKVVQRQLRSSEIDKLLRLWCEEIEQGYQHTSLKL